MCSRWATEQVLIFCQNISVYKPTDQRFTSQPLLVSLRSHNLIFHNWSTLVTLLMSSTARNNVNRRYPRSLVRVDAFGVNFLRKSKLQDIARYHFLHSGETRKSPPLSHIWYRALVNSWILWRHFVFARHFLSPLAAHYWRILPPRPYIFCLSAVAKSDGFMHVYNFCPSAVAKSDVFMLPYNFLSVDRR